MKNTNDSLAVFLLNDDVRMIEGIYEDDRHGNKPTKWNFKTLDQTIVEGDLVLVPTDVERRAGHFTTIRVTAVDVEPNFNSTRQYKWTVGRVDTTTYDYLVSQEKTAIAEVKSAERAALRRELKKAMVTDREEKFSALAITNLEDVSGGVPQDKPTTKSE